MVEAPELYARIYARHGHRCPMSTLGARLGLAALAALGPGDGPLQATYHMRTCALDGIAETTGCREEDGSLTVTGEARHALRLQRGAVGVEVALSAGVMQAAGGYRKLCNELEQGWDALDEAERQRRQALMAAALDALLPQLWTAPDCDLIDVTLPNGNPEPHHG